MDNPWGRNYTAVVRDLPFRLAAGRHTVDRMEAMRTRDGTWTIHVAGVGPLLRWYRIVGPGVDRWRPSETALLVTLDELGVDLADLVEVQPA